MTGRAVVRAVTVDEVVAGGVVLTLAERRRRDRLRRAQDRQAYESAHVLVRQCAAELIGLCPEELELRHACGECGGRDHGAPYLVGVPEVHVSLSHSDGFVAAVAARVRCGVDVERVDAGRVVEGALTAEERSWVRSEPDPALAFAALWTRKEALVKAGALTLDRAGSVAVHVGSRLLDRWCVGTVARQGLHGRGVASWVLDDSDRHHTAT